MENRDLEKQILFLKEIDRMKSVLRQNHVIEEGRREDDAGHSWHAAVMAMTLAPYAKPQVQADRAIRMLLIHDLVEIYAGDTPCFDSDVVATQAAREQTAADKVAARALWEEFDRAETDDAQFAAAVDRLQPLLLNYFTNGASWVGRTVTRAQVYKRNELVKTVMPALWPFVEHAVETCYQKRLLKA